MLTENLNLDYKWK